MNPLRACLIFAIASKAFGTTFDWDIQPKEMKVYSVFSSNEASVDHFIDFRYEIPLLYPGKTCSFDMFEYDCTTPFQPGLMVGNADTSVAEELLLTIRIDMAAAAASALYNAVDSVSGQLKFCVRVDCGLEGIGSVNFHETKTTIEFDLLTGFTTQASLEKEVEDPYATNKVLQSYTLTIHPVEKLLVEGDLTLLFVASDKWMTAEVNFQLLEAGVNNSVIVFASAISQKLVQVSLRRALRALQDNTATGVQIEVDVNAEFENYPAPSTENVDAVVAETLNDPSAGENFLGNLTAAIHEAGTFCTSPLANISRVEFEYQKNLTLTSMDNGEDIPVNSTTFSFSLQDIEDYENYIDTCGGDPFPNISLPILKGKTVIESFNVEIQETVDAYFCDDTNNLVLSPVLSQADILQVCVTMEANPMFHVEDTFTFVLSQLGTAVAPFPAIQQGINGYTEIFQKSCSLGVCNHKMQVPSRFFYDPQPLQISGISILNFGEANRFLREPLISVSQLPSPSYFGLQVLLRGENAVLSEISSRNSGIILGLVLGALGLCLSVVAILYRHRVNKIMGVSPSKNGGRAAHASSGSGWP